MSNPSTRPSRFRRWPLFLVLGLVVALAVVWTGFWFYAAAQAKTEIASWRERERQAGRHRTAHPFRLEVIPSASRCGAQTGTLSCKAPRRCGLICRPCWPWCRSMTLVCSSASSKGRSTFHSRAVGTNLSSIGTWVAPVRADACPHKSSGYRLPLTLSRYAIQEPATPIPPSRHSISSSMGVKLPGRELLIRRSKRYCRSSTQPRKRCTPLPRRRSMRTLPA